MSKKLQLLLGSVLAVALAIYVYPTQKGQHYRIFNLMEQRPATLSAQPKQNYSFFHLVQLWPKTYCFKNRHCRDKIPNYFTIHGLWPQPKSGRLRNCCENNTHWNRDCIFRQIQDNRLLRELKKAWPSLNKSLDDQSFWKSQWDKHGTCSLPNVSQVRYFQNAVNLSNTYNLTRIILRPSGIPNDNNSYAIAKITEGIKNATGVKALIKCGGSKNIPDNYLHEVTLCVNGDATNLRDCEGHNKCKRNISHVIIPR